MSGRRDASRGLLAAGALAFAASVAGFCLYITVRSPGWTATQIDLQVYRAGGLIARHVSPPYTPRLATPLYGWAGLPGLPLKFTYPPFAATVFAAVTLLPWRALRLLSVGANIALLAAACAFTFRGLGWRPGRALAGAALLAAAFALWAEPVLRTIYLGQVNLALMALILWDLTGRSGRASRWWRGAGVGLAAGVKLVPLIFIPYLLLTRRFRQAATATAVFAATAAAGFAALPGDSARWWLRGLFFAGGRTGFVGWAGNQSLRGLTVRLAGDVAGSKPAWLAVAALTAVAGLACAAALHRAGHAMAGVLACALTGLLVSPISWDHHWVWAAPGATAAACYAAREWRRRGLRPVAAPAPGWPAAGLAAVAAGLCLVFAPWPGSWWQPRRDLGPFSLGLIWAAPNTNPSIYYRLGDRPWYPEYHWHGLQLAAGNAYLLAGLAMLALLAVLAARAWRAGTVHAPALTAIRAGSGVGPGRG